MKKIKLFSTLLLSVGLLLAITPSCNKTEDQEGGDFTSAGIVKDIDSNEYHTLKIGTQVWMVENLKTTKYNDGTEIPNVTDYIDWANLLTGAYCNYENLESNAAIYGRLYNWYAVNTGKLAPAGWHIPTDEDWTQLENYLIEKGFNYDGTTTENKLAKSLSAKAIWKLSRVAGSPGAAPENNNITGFTGLPGGFRYYYGYFYSLGENVTWWSSSGYKSFTPCCRSLGSQNVSLVRTHSYADLSTFKTNAYELFGLYIRLIRDKPLDGPLALRIEE